jgi:glycosyltransferase involved in cell wall biosynthesis
MADDMPAQFTILIPAYNEGAVIGSTLRALSDGSASETAPEIIVICNGCVDDTAEQARLALPSARVIEIAEASKALAINTGLDLARSGSPVIIVDGDVLINLRSLTALANTLREPGVMAASPAPKLNLAECDPWVSAYYRVWQEHSYRHVGVGGSGVYGLSAAAVEQLGRFPLIIADDSFVRSSFPLSRQRRLTEDADGRPVFSVVRAPRHFRNLIACESRWRAGDAELRQFRPGSATARDQAREARSLWSRRSSALDLGIYYLIKLLGRAAFTFNRLSGRSGRWHRDSSTRAL